MFAQQELNAHEIWSNILSMEHAITFNGVLLNDIKQMSVNDVASLLENFNDTEMYALKQLRYELAVQRICKAPRNLNLQEHFNNILDLVEAKLLDTIKLGTIVFIDNPEIEIVASLPPSMRHQMNQLHKYLNHIDLETNEESVQQRKNELRSLRAFFKNTVRALGYQENSDKKKISFSTLVISKIEKELTKLRGYTAHLHRPIVKRPLTEVVPDELIGGWNLRTSFGYDSPQPISSDSAEEQESELVMNR